jgi:hypothetical protein
MTDSTSAHGVAQRLAFALPDAVSAATFALIWVAPLAFGPHAVRNAMLLMLIEFIMVHSAGFLGTLLFASDKPRRTRIGALLGMGLFYTLFVAAFCLAFDAWWPLAAFAWLLLGKLIVIMDGGAMSEQKKQRMQTGWGLGVAAYIGGVFLTTLLPVPRLGMGADIQPQFGLPGSGLWVEEPQRVIAFGLLYFGFLSWSKWKDWNPGAKATPRA